MTVHEFKKILAKGHLYRFLYHFTDKANLKSIAKHGILSKKRASNSKVKISVFGGNEWSHNADTLKGLEDYVSLCFTTEHPMLYKATMDGRIANPYHLLIDPNVLKIPDVKITLGISNKADVELLNVEEGLSKLDHEVLYTHTNWSDPKIQDRLQNARKCEILVPNVVSVKMIKSKI